jgi:exopolysaccharide biosynthesis protein PssK
MPDDPLITMRRTELTNALRQVLEPGSPVVLLDIPRHANVGDNAILLGELALLRDLGHSVVQLPTPPRYDARRLRRLVGPRPLMLHGGGNLGDLWPAHQLLRERILADFRDHPVIQLPQSIAFTNAEWVTRAHQAFASHGRFTLMVRDVASRAFAAERLGVESTLVPDAAFALGPLTRPRLPERDVLVLARTDHEAREDRHLPPAVVAEDWNASRLTSSGRALERFGKAADRRPGRSDPVAAGLGWLSTVLWSRVAAEHFRHGVELLSSARVVVTDRLHAHILSLLLGIPHIVTDNISGKVRGFYEAWTSTSPLVTWADTLAEGVDAAQRVAAAGRAAA